MSKEIYDKKINNIIHSIGLNNNLRDDDIRLIIESQFKFTYETIKNINFEELSDDEIDDLKKVFYYKYLGKLYTSSDVIKRQKNKINYIKTEEENG